jgi:hypothetical protein
MDLGLAQFTWKAGVSAIHEDNQVANGAGSVGDVHALISAMAIIQHQTNSEKVKS